MLWWEWLFLAGLIGALLGWLLRAMGSEVRWIQVLARVLLIGGSCVIAVPVALYGSLFTVFVYAPSTWFLDDGPVLTAVVWLEAALIFAAVAMAFRRKVITGLPVLLFVAITVGLGAWLFLHPLEWLPTPT